MTNVVSCGAAAEQLHFNSLANALATRLEQGAEALGKLASSLTDAQWQTPMPGDGRTIGVIVHHVASVYPLEIQLAQRLAQAQPITGVTAAEVNAMNAQHADEFRAVSQQNALALLQRNSAAAAAAIRAFSDEDLAQSATVSLYGDAPLTCQFLLEDHAVRHSYHHLSRIKQALAL